MNDTTVKVKQYSQEEFLGIVLLAALEGNYKIAIWKKPKESMVQIIIDKNEKIKRVPLRFENLPAGFIVHPFADQEDKKAFYLEANDYFRLDLREEKTASDQLNSLVGADLDQHLVKTKIKKNLIRQHRASAENETNTSTSKEEFIEEVTKGIEAINSGHLFKIVPVRRKTVNLREQFNIVKAYLNLCKAYPTAFVNFFHIPTFGSWIGASPEILIKTKGDIFSTMSLAGSQKAVGNNPLKHVAWTQKEIEEQALVSRYIVNCFKKIRLREYEEVGPKTDIAGNLLHLRTDFKVNMKATGFPLLGSVMLELLHPTSAVGGMPRDKAMEFIQKNEKFDRSLFSGFIGPVNIEDETAIFVNLRCARLLPYQAILYAGAGVTEDSVPEKEWEETEFKCDIIGKFIQ
jgi:isochorismate synthase